MPPPVMDYKINKIRLRGTASDEAWKIIYGDFNYETFVATVNAPAAGPHDTQAERHAQLNTIIGAPIHRHVPLPEAEAAVLRAAVTTKDEETGRLVSDDIQTGGKKRTCRPDWVFFGDNHPDNARMPWWYSGTPSGTPGEAARAPSPGVPGDDPMGQEAPLLAPPPPPPGPPPPGAFLPPA